MFSCLLGINQLLIFRLGVAFNLFAHVSGLFLCQRPAHINKLANVLRLVLRKVLFDSELDYRVLCYRV